MHVKAVEVNYLPRGGQFDSTWKSLSARRLALEG